MPIESAEQPWILKMLDHESASNAMKTLGLPLVLYGIMTLWRVGMQLSQIQGTWTTPNSVIAPIAMGLFFVIVGLRIRKGQFGSVPIAILSYFVNISLDVLVFPLIAKSVPVLFGLLALNGLRGWWWGMRNPI